MTARSATAATELHADVTEETIAIMVELFYDSVRRHPTLGPIFSVPGVEKAHFGDWLGLFEETLKTVYHQDVAKSIHDVS